MGASIRGSEGDLKSWISRQLRADMAAIEVVQITGRTFQAIERYSIEQEFETKEEDEVDSFVETVLDLTEADADGSATKSQYCCLAYKDSDSSKHKSRSVRWVCESEDIGGTEDDFDIKKLAGAIPHQIVTQSLRAQREILFEFRSLAHSSFGVLVQQNKMLNERLQYYEGRDLEIIKLREKLANKDHKRAMEALTAEREQDRKDKAIKAIGSILPDVAGGFMGYLQESGMVKKLPANNGKEESSSTDDNVVPIKEQSDDEKKLSALKLWFAEIFESLSEDELEKLQTIVGTRRMMNLQKLMISPKLEGFDGWIAEVFNSLTDDELSGLQELLGLQRALELKKIVGWE